MKHKKILSEIIDEVGISQTKEWQIEARNFYKHSDKNQSEKRQVEFEYILHKFNNYLTVKQASERAGRYC